MGPHQCQPSRFADGTVGGQVGLPGHPAGFWWGLSQAQVSRAQASSSRCVPAAGVLIQTLVWVSICGVLWGQSWCGVSGGGTPWTGVLWLEGLVQEAFGS